MLDIMEGVNHLHTNGIYHCDLKPENILCTRIEDGDIIRDTLKICDFGLSHKDEWDFGSLHATDQGIQLCVIKSTTFGIFFTRRRISLYKAGTNQIKIKVNNVIKRKTRIKTARLRPFSPRGIRSIIG